MQQHAAIDCVTGATSDELPIFVNAVTRWGFSSCIKFKVKYNHNKCIKTQASFEGSYVRPKQKLKERTEV